MKNTFGNSVAITLFGESHGPEIGAVLDGLAPGIAIDEAFIAHQLDLRRPAGAISTARHETDAFRIVSGVFEGKTTGTPLTILIPNSAQSSKDYAATRALARPGHADYTAFAKYHGFEAKRMRFVLSAVFSKAKPPARRLPFLFRTALKAAKTTPQRAR